MAFFVCERIWNNVGVNTFFTLFFVIHPCHSCRKGIPCHDQIVDGLIQNIPIGAGDRVLFLDLLPNRFLAYHVVFCSELDMFVRLS